MMSISALIDAGVMPTEAIRIAEVAALRGRLMDTVEHIMAAGITEEDRRISRTWVHYSVPMGGFDLILDAKSR